MARLVLLNALPLNMFGDVKRVSMVVERIGIDDLKRLVRIHRDVACYIRHASTVKVLSDALGIELRISNSVYRYAVGDDIVVVTLKRPVRGQEVEVSISDLELFRVRIDAIDFGGYVWVVA